jgi:hypothetical protein
MAAPITINNLESLIARISEHMTVNGNRENTGERTQQLLKEMVLGIIAIIGAAPTPTGSITPWDASLEYLGNQQVLVTHGGGIYLFVGADTDQGTQPGTDPSVWMDLSALLLSHTQGTDQMLDDGGSNEVTAAEIRAHLDSPTEVPPLADVLAVGHTTGANNIEVDAGQKINFRGPESDGTLSLRPISVSDDNTIYLPDKYGTIALLDDLAGVAALVDGTLKAPEAFSPAGSYPTTYDGDPVQKGDTFRMAAGTMGAVTVNAEDLLVALVDTPGQVDASWQVIESNRTVVDQTGVENSATADNSSIVSPLRWWQAWSKGLTLAGFAAAVRGVLLTGYAAGTNVAIVATDSVLVAFGKVQAQLTATNAALNGKLAKASNLSDLTSVSGARMNLGLGKLATKDYVQAIVDETLVFQEAHGLAIGDLVRHDGSVWVKSRAVSDDEARVTAMVVAVPDPAHFRLLRRGLWADDVFSSVVRGAQYYLDPVTAGAWTDTRPSGRVVPVFVGMPDRSVDFTPTSSEEPSGGLITSGQPTSETVGDGGVEVAGMSFAGAAGAVYRVHVEAWVQTDSVGECVSLAIIPPSGTVIGRLFKQTTSTGDCIVQAFRNGGELNAEGTAIEELKDMAYIIEAEVTCDAGGPVRLFLASSSSSAVAMLQKDSHLRWERLN